jgi:polyketide biosynthesis enoyl-CoA hydratase PksI
MSSRVVLEETIAPGVIQLTMQDHVHKNTFSDELIAGLQSAFQRIEADTACRVVVLTGYDTYFCSGGTQASLLALQEGRVEFTDMSIYSAPLNCAVPVISAMQGHGIGGGFVFGLFADCAVLAREAVYTANFMKYGFTPGMGASHVLPIKLGLSLASEMLLSARSYRGAELERRGIPFTVLPRVDVLPHAQQLARELADKPRDALVELKSHLVSGLRAALPAIVADELAMHRRTFHRPEVRERIQNAFGPDALAK